ncbi:MAG TPA: peptide chain release factor N(5)-glutamine methyltransferase, partial [Dokdonella sp.]|nr:peptide chain release factor N(5)-glutamine methyltransferase [Dokdonella sp.]
RGRSARHPVSGFKDHFSSGSAAYALHRPRYPDALFAWLADVAPGRALAWDAATGSGQAATGLAEHFERVVATDASADALAVARANARRLGIDNVEFAHGDWFVPLEDARFALVASNPPYIAADDPHLAQGDLRHEPACALASGRDGLDAIRSIVADAPAHLLPHGWLLVEHGWTQGEAVRALFARHGFGDVQSVRDLGGHERVTLGRRGA